MADARVVKEWLEKADEELHFSISIIEDSIFYSQICFHFHQAAEKYLKAAMIALDAEFKRIHDLPVLLKTCLPMHPPLQRTASSSIGFMSIPDILFTGRPNTPKRKLSKHKPLLSTFMMSLPKLFRGFPGSNKGMSVSLLIRVNPCKSVSHNRFLIGAVVTVRGERIRISKGED